LSDRVCYIRRSDRGATLKGLRLLSGHTDDTWNAGASTDPVLIEESIAEGARWVHDRLEANASKTRTLSLLCLDPDGAVCSWVKADDADLSLLDATLATGPVEYDPDSLEEQVHSGASDRFPRLPLELSFELLDPDETSTGSRTAVMAMPDVPGRLIKDELDALGIRIDCFTTIWHTIANVWDPGAGHAAHSEQRIVSSDSPIVAVLVIDPKDARLIWTWSRMGKLIAAGTTRITTLTSEHGSMALIRKEDIARVCADWLGWSSQLGVAPSRVSCIGKPAQIPVEDEQNKDQSPLGLSTGEIGAALAQAWPEATIDLVEHDDPIGETLRKVASGQRAGSIISLSALSNRPVRAHRSMYRWGAVAMVMVSAIIGLIGYQFLTQASAIKKDTRRIENQRMTVLNEYDPEMIRSLSPTMDLQNKLAQMRRKQGPLRVAKTKPILEELETLSYVFGIPGIEIDNITLSTTTVTVTVRVDDITQAEQINQSLEAIEGSHLDWRNMTPTNRGQQIQATFMARWVDGEGNS
jgi:hypothetical protein